MGLNMFVFFKGQVYHIVTNFVEKVDAGYVNSVTLNDINQVISRSIILEHNVSIMDTVLS